jgi:UDP-N-acetylmuramoyl-tripeptide--D-alanyl-D-alanine ligase
MSFFSPANIAAVTGGAWAAEPTRSMRGASIDTRTLQPGNVFFALRGERVDGHAFVDAALEAGAGAVVVEDASAASNARGGALVVPSVSRALTAMGAAVRADMASRGVVVVGVTGSNGKTTAVRLIEAALRGSRRVHRPESSFNNDLGLPLTLLNAADDAEVVICEMGISRPGDMARLVVVARPDIRVITSIGPAHLEALGSVDGVAVEKSVIFRGDAAGSFGPVAVYPAGIAGEPGRIVEEAASLVSRRACVPCDAIETGGGRTLFRCGGVLFEIPMDGAHNAMNAAIAVSVARAIGADDDAIRAGLAGAEPPTMRLMRERVSLADGGTVLVINDAYNANPASMAAAIDVLAAEPIQPIDGGGRRIAIIGDMRELGERGPDMHRELGERIAGLPEIGMVVCVGTLMGFAAERVARARGPERVVPAASLDAASLAMIAGLVRDGDVVLLKGSRAMGMERVARAIGSCGDDDASAGGGGYRVPGPGRPGSLAG